MIYFDNAATRRPSDEVLKAFNEISVEHFASSSSNHKAGFESNKYLTAAREGILKLLNVENTHKLLFTSGATEANNIAIKGVAHKYKNRGKKIISCINEHASVLNVLKELESEGFEIVLLPVNKEGSVDFDSLKKAIDSSTILVSLMSVNNEVGSYNPVKEISNLIKQYPKCFFHLDATQSMGKDNIDHSLADLITFSSHKFAGLKGNGCLIYKSSIMFDPISNGGSQEEGFRPGTVNLAGAYTTYIALAHEYKHLEKNFIYAKSLKDALTKGLLATNEVEINSPSNSSPFILNISLKTKKASVVVEALSSKEIYVSSLSACSKKTNVVSNTLLGMGKSEESASNSIRISFSEENTIDEINQFLDAFKQIIIEVVNR